MMLLHKGSTVVAAVGSLAAFMISHEAPIGVDGHAYLMGPVSRQYWNSQVFQDEDFKNLEECPQCYNAGGEVKVRERAIEKTDPDVLAQYGNGYYPLRWVYDNNEMAENGNYIEPQAISVRHGVCGDPRQNQPETWNEYGTPNKEWPILDEFTEGQVMEIKAVMSAYHWGHLEYFICNADDLDDPDGVVTQECFNMYPLTRAEGDDVNSPIDPNFPGRYYCDPECREDETDQTHDIRSAGGYVMTMNYQLPKGLTCKRCILQMVYFTGHKCRHPGYEEFNPPSWPGECAPNKEDWITLEPEYCGDKEWIYAEEFWGCADFSIMAGDGSSPEAPSPTPPTDPKSPTAEPSTVMPVEAEPQGTPSADKDVTTEPVATPTADKPVATPTADMPVTAPKADMPVSTDDKGDDADPETASPASAFPVTSTGDDDFFNDDPHSYSYGYSYEFSFSYSYEYSDDESTESTDGSLPEAPSPTPPTDPKAPSAAPSTVMPMATPTATPTADKDVTAEPVATPTADMPVMAPTADMPVMAPTADKPVMAPTADMPVSTDDKGDDADPETASPTSSFPVTSTGDDDFFNDDSLPYSYSYSYEFSFSYSYEYSDDESTESADGPLPEAPSPTPPTDPKAPSAAPSTVMPVATPTATPTADKDVTAEPVAMPAADMPIMAPTADMPVSTDDKGDDADPETASPTSSFPVTSTGDDDFYNDDSLPYSYSYSYEYSFSYSYEYSDDEATESTNGPADGDEDSPAGGGGGDPECTDPIDIYEQCGGKDYTGSTCCHTGYVCTEMAPCYSQCRYPEKGS